MNSLILFKKITSCIKEHRLPSRFTSKLRKISEILMIIFYDFKLILSLNVRERFICKKIESWQSTSIYPVYFSCKKHFEYLFTSLKSLERIRSNYIGNVYLYIDKFDFLTEEQIAQLKNNLSLTIILRKTKYAMYATGPGLIINELVAFKEISGEIDSADYIAKLDSDTFFVSDKKLKEVTESNFLIIGQLSANKFALENFQFLWLQGGCYFLHNSILSSLTDFPLLKIIIESCKKTGHSFPNCCEDAVIHIIGSKITDKVKYEDFIEFFWEPYRTEWSLTEMINKIDTDWGKYSVYHFSRKQYWPILVKRVTEKLAS